MTALSWDPGSFNVKYKCPVFHSRQLEISPSTQTSTYAVSRRFRMPAVSSVTVWMVRRGATGSSSNGNSNGELMLDFLCRQAQAPHGRRLSGSLIGSNQN